MVLGVRVDIGDGVRLYVDIDGLGLVPVDGKLEQRPTLLLLHGGPGFDHATFKLGMHELRDVAQVVMYDHRGQGRSDRRTAEEWNLNTWADDVVRLCDALGVDAPVVFGNSFGGWVAQRYMGRHPHHPAKVILSSTTARWKPDVTMFRQLGGEEAAEAATEFWTTPSPESRARYLQVCMPLYTQSPGSTADAVDMIRAPEVVTHWSSNERKTFDTQPDLAKARCPVLVLAGEFDPVCPIAETEELVSCLPSRLVQFERFARSGHGVFRDEKDKALDVIRMFVTS